MQVHAQFAGRWLRATGSRTKLKLSMAKKVVRFSAALGFKNGHKRMASWRSGRRGRSSDHVQRPVGNTGLLEN